MDHQHHVIPKSTDGYLPHYKTRVLSYYDNCLNNGLDVDGHGTKLTIANVAKKFSIHSNTLSDWLNERKLKVKGKNTVSVSVSATTKTKPIKQLEQQQQQSEFVIEFESTIIRFLEQLLDQLENDLEGFGDDSSGYVLKFSTTVIANKVVEFFYDSLEKVEGQGSEIDKKGLLCSWMTSWAKKIYESQYNEDKNEVCINRIKDLIPSCSLIKYSEQFKRQIVKFASILGQRKTSRMFEISQRQIYDWNKIFQEDSESDDDTEVNEDDGRGPQNSLKDNGNAISKSAVAQVLNLEIEQELYNWVQTQLPRKCSSREIRQKALELYTSQGYTNIKCSYGWYQRWCKRFKKTDHKLHENTDQPVIIWFLEQLDENEIITYPKLQNAARNLLHVQIPTFKASLHWAYRFIKRNHAILNPNIHYSESLPPQLEVQANACLATICSILQLAKFTPNQVVCMDEIPLNFCSPLRSEDPKSWKASLKNCEATLIIGVLLSGEVLPPYVIVKGQKLDNLEKLCIKSSSPDVRLLYSKSSEPTVSSLEKWFDSICPGNILLLWDSYNLHMDTQIKTKCIEKYVTTITFPKGTSIKLQPINIFIRDHILTKIGDQWKEYHTQVLRNGQNSISNSVIVPSADKIVEWVNQSIVQMSLAKNQISNSFEECLGINKST